MDTIRHYDYPELRIYWKDEGTLEAAAESASGDGVRWLFAFNMPCYGGGLQIAPQADATDGMLDVCTFRHGGILHGLYYTAAVLTGTHHWLNDFTTRRSGSFCVTAEKKVPYQLDGDPGGFLPVEISVLPQRLTLVVPRESTRKSKQISSTLPVVDGN
jgi:diacylglycerol kinase family enzyme